MIDPGLLDAPHYEITLERLPRAPTTLPQDYFPEAPLGHSLQGLEWGYLYTILPLQQPRVFSRVALLQNIGRGYQNPRTALDWLLSHHSDVSKEEQRVYVLGILEKGRRIFEWLFLQENLRIRAKVRLDWKGLTVEELTPAGQGVSDQQEDEMEDGRRAGEVRADTESAGDQLAFTVFCLWGCVGTSYNDINEMLRRAGRGPKKPSALRQLKSQGAKLVRERYASECPHASPQWLLTLRRQKLAPILPPKAPTPRA